jgi:prepilin-type N-terminal cleavage/methylation domain-containing protein
MKSLRATQNGFTLVELAVATAITGILIIVVMSFTINSFAQISRDSARSDLLREAQISLDAVTQDIRLSSNSYDASSILDENAPGGSDEWTGGANVLILATAAQDRNRNIIFADPLNYTSEKNNRIYFVNDGTLYRRTLAADVANNAVQTSCPEGQNGCPRDSKLAENVRNFSVKYYDGNSQEVSPNEARSVEVTLELQVRKYGQNIAAKYSTRTVFRNE